MEWDETFDNDVIYKDEFAEMDLDDLLGVIRSEGGKSECLLDLLMNEVRDGLGDSRMSQRGMYAMLRGLRARVTNIRNAHRHYSKTAPKFNRGKVFELVKASKVMITAAKDVTNRTDSENPVGDLEAAYENIMADYDEDGRFVGNRG